MSEILNFLLDNDDDYCIMPLYKTTPVTGQTMKISQVSLPCMVETQTDAIQHLYNFSALARYIVAFGDVSVVFDDTRNIYRVPSFAKKIKSYTEFKTVDCARWGCE